MTHLMFVLVFLLLSHPGLVTRQWRSYHLSLCKLFCSPSSFLVLDLWPGNGAVTTFRFVNCFGVPPPFSSWTWDQAMASYHRPKVLAMSVILLIDIHFWLWCRVACLCLTESVFFEKTRHFLVALRIVFVVAAFYAVSTVVAAVFFVAVVFVNVVVVTDLIATVSVGLVALISLCLSLLTLLLWLPLPPLSLSLMSLSLMLSLSLSSFSFILVPLFSHPGLGTRQWRNYYPSTFYGDVDILPRGILI